MSTKYRFRVVGDERIRARGDLPFVFPQAIDLVAKSSYVATISEAENPARGVLRLRRTGDGSIEAQYEANPTIIGNEEWPVWLDSIQRLGEQLGRNITWQARP